MNIQHVRGFCSFVFYLMILSTDILTN